MVYQKRIQIDTRGHGDVHDLTRQVARVVAESEVDSGICHVFNVGSTGAIGCIEFEPGLQRDVHKMLDQLIPAAGEYAHEQAWHDGNAHSHLQATMLSQSVTVPIRHNEPVLGTWQQIFHLECDVRPHRRTIIVTVTGE